MNCVKNSVLLKKLQRIENLNKYVKLIILDISKGATEVRPVYKIPNKLTVVNVLDELIKILFILNLNFAVSNDAPRKGKIGTIITIKTKVNTHSVLTKKLNTNGNNTTKARAPD